MLIKVNTILKNLYGEPLKGNRKETPKKTGPGEEPKLLDLTVREVLVNSLLAEFPGEKIDGEEKLKRYKLAIKIQEAKAEVDLSSEEIVKVKELVGKGWTPLISGQVWELIEPK